MIGGIYGVKVGTFTSDCTIVSPYEREHEPSFYGWNMRFELEHRRTCFVRLKDLPRIYIPKINVVEVFFLTAQNSTSRKKRRKQTLKEKQSDVVDKFPARVITRLSVAR